MPDPNDRRTVPGGAQTSTTQTSAQRSTTTQATVPVADQKEQEEKLDSHIANNLRYDPGAVQGYFIYLIHQVINSNLAMPEARKLVHSWWLKAKAAHPNPRELAADCRRTLERLHLVAEALYTEYTVASQIDR